MDSRANLYATFPSKIEASWVSRNGGLVADEYCGNGIANGNVDPQQLRSILRRKSREHHRSAPFLYSQDFCPSSAAPPPPLILTDDRHKANRLPATINVTSTKTFQSSKHTRWQSLYACLVRPCLAEFVAVLVAVFLSKHIEAQLVNRQVAFFTRVTLLASLDAAIVGVFLSAFETSVQKD